MDQQEFEAGVKTDLARDLQLGRINEEIKRAGEEVDREYARERAKRTPAATELMLAHRNLHFWLAKKIIAERGLYV